MFPFFIQFKPFRFSLLSMHECCHLRSEVELTLNLILRNGQNLVFRPYLKTSLPNPTTEVAVALPTKDFEDGSFASPDVQITMCVVFSGKVI